MILSHFEYFKLLCVTISYAITSSFTNYKSLIYCFQDTTYIKQINTLFVRGKII